MVDTEESYQAPRAGYQGKGHIVYEDVAVFSLSQRLNRLRYACYSFTSSLIMFLVMVLSAVLSAAAFQGSKIGGLISLIVMLGLSLIWIVYFLTLVVRRLHDLGKSGWLALLFLTPLLSIPLVYVFPMATTLLFILGMVPPLLSLYLLVGAGDSGMNYFGTPNPPNSMLVMIFGGMCSFLSVLLLLVQVAIMGSQFFAPGQLEKVMKKYPGIDPHRIERMMRQYEHGMKLNH